MSGYKFTEKLDSFQIERNITSINHCLLIV